MLRVFGSVTRTGFTAEFDLALPLEGVTAVLGASGAGKSTLLRCIAGLDATPIEVEVDGECWQGNGTFVPPHRRSVSMVFQDGRLFPHLTVRDNLAFPLVRAARAGTRLALGDVVDTLALAPLLDRRPATLSGGQRQRVALARALLAPARLWLLDEPLSSLDSDARREIAPYLADLCRARAIPTLYVTHALDEVHHLASRVLVLDHGRVIANQSIDDAGAIAPLDERGARGEVLRARAVHYLADVDLTELAIGSHRLYVAGRVADGATVRVLVAARDVGIALADVADISILNRLPAVVTALTEETSSSCLVVLDCDGQRLRARITQLSRKRLGLMVGMPVVALIKSVALA